MLFETLEHKKLKANKLFVWIGKTNQSLQIINLSNALALSKHGLTGGSGMRQRSLMTSYEGENLSQMKENELTADHKSHVDRVNELDLVNRITNFKPARARAHDFSVCDI